MTIHLDGSGGGINIQRVSAHHSGLAHATCHNSCVRGLATTGGQDTLGSNHTGKVIRVRLTTNQHTLHSIAGRSFSLSVVKDNLSDCRTGRCRHAAGDQFLLCARIKLREHQLSELVTGNAAEGFVAGNHLLVNQLGGNTEGGGSALANAGLQHPQLAALDGELNVTQVAVVSFKLAHDGTQFLVRLGIALFQG